MATTKVAISLDSKLLHQLDRLVAERVFRNRSQAVQDAIRDKLERLRGPDWHANAASSTFVPSAQAGRRKPGDRTRRNGRNTERRNRMG